MALAENLAADDKRLKVKTCRICRFFNGVQKECLILILNYWHKIFYKLKCSLKEDMYLKEYSEKHIYMQQYIMLSRY